MFKYSKKTYTYLVVLLCLIISLYYLGILRTGMVLARIFLSPITTEMQQLNIYMRSAFSPTLNNNERTDYIQTKEELSVAKTKITILSNENNDLKDQLNYKKNINYKIITSRVISRDFDNVTKSIILDQGSNAGVKLNAAVVAGTGVFVGKIIKVEPDIAIARLINDSQAKLSATVLNTTKSLGAVEGGHGLSLRLQFIPRDEMIIVGDQVITSGFEEQIPRGILIGNIAVIENEAYQPFQSAILTPGTDLNKLLIVGVVVTNQ